MGSQQIMIYMMKMTGFKFFDTKNIEKSIDYANEMASIVVGKRGVVTP